MLGTVSLISLVALRPTHTFAQDGTHIVSLVVTDNDGLTAQATFTVNVSNVAPVLGTPANATVNAGSVYTLAGSFADPGADHWTVTVNWGDGSAPDSLPTDTRSFSFAHTYATAGTYSVMVSVADDDTSTSATSTVTVKPLGPDLSGAYPLIDQLVAGHKLTRDMGNVLKAEIGAAERLFAKNKPQCAVMVLRAAVVELDLLVRFRALKASDAAPLRRFLLSAIGSV